MARYEVTSPTGERFEITAPDKATESEVMAYAQSSFMKPEAPAPKPQPVARPPRQDDGRDSTSLYGMLQNAADAAVSTVRGAVIDPAAAAVEATLGLGGNMIDKGASALGIDLHEADKAITKATGITNGPVQVTRNIRNGLQQNYGQSTAGKIGGLTGTVVGTLPLGGIRATDAVPLLAGKTTWPARVIDGAVQGGTAAAVTSQGFQDSSVAAQTGAGTALGAAVNAVLPPALQTAVRMGKGMLPASSAVPPPTIIDDAISAARETLPQGKNLPGATRIGSEVADNVLAGTQSVAGRGVPLPAAVRTADINAVGVGTPRAGAVTGNPVQLSREMELSKSWTPSGEKMAGQLETERLALRGFADDIGLKTGGTPGAEAADRGSAVMQALNGVDGWYDDNIRTLYREAEKRAAEKGSSIPMLGTIKEIQNNQSKFLGTQEGTALLSGLQRRMQELGIIADAGNGRVVAKGVTAAQAESLRQYLGEVWTPRTSRVISTLKNSIDDDVTRSAGADIYNSARKLRATKARLLDDPSGVAKLLEETGINRAVATERVPEFIARLDNSQLNHIKSTLSDMPTDELNQAGSQAWNEVRAHIWQDIVNKSTGRNGAWNAARFSEEINRIGTGRLRVLFSPDEIKQIATLQRAGHHLTVPDKNPSGTASMAMNLVREANVGNGGVGGFVRGGAQRWQDKSVLLESLKGPVAAIPKQPLPVVPVSSISEMIRRALSGEGVAQGNP